jgi:hypothetical protein
LHPNEHVRIARKVAMDIGRVDLSSTLEHYSVIPDKWRDFPHHTGGRYPKRICRRVFRARNYYIHGDDYRAAAELGVAFHYIADEHVLVRGSDRRHVSYESKISRAPLNNQDIDSIEGKETTFEYINEKMRELSNRQYLLTPETALNSAYKICASIAKSVFGPKNSLELQLILMELKKTYIEKMKRVEEEFVNKLIETARKDQEIENLRGMNKVVNKIIKTFSFFDFRFRRNIRRYQERKHLENSVKSYFKEVALTIESYKDWYLIKTPELSIWAEEVKPNLLTAESIMDAFNLDKQTIKKLEGEAKISVLRLKDAEFVKREDIPKIAAYLNKPNPLAETCISELSLVPSQANLNKIAVIGLFGRYVWNPTNIPLSELKNVMPSGVVSDNAERVGISQALINLFEEEMIVKVAVTGQRLLLLAEEDHQKYLATVDLEKKVFACNCPLYDGELPCKHVLLTICHYHDIILGRYASHKAHIWREALIKAQQHTHRQVMLCNWIYYFFKEFVSHLNLKAGRYEDLKAVERLKGDLFHLETLKIFSFRNHSSNHVVTDSVPPKEVSQKDVVV